MLDLNELWIGDKLLLLKSGRKGTFQGISGSKARVKVGSKILLVAATGLQLSEDPETIAPDLELDHPPTKPLSFHNFPDTLDLHIEVLAPEMANQPPLAVLNHQLYQLDSYLTKAEAAGAKYLTIIHGKGTGVLRREVLHLLKGRAPIQYILEKHDGGAVELHMK